MLSTRSMLKARICYICYIELAISVATVKAPNQDASFVNTREKDHSCSTDHACIKCEGDHLAISHTCPIIIKHKTILLAAQDNIPLVEVKKIVASNSYLPPSSHNTLLDFKNFPYFQSHTSAKILQLSLFY